MWVLSKKVDLPFGCVSGNSDIDSDHIYLIGLVEEIKDLIGIAGSSEKVVDILTELTKYSGYHFESEERYMSEYKYPEIEEHMRLHREFMTDVAMFNVRYIERKVSAEELYNYLKIWLEEHLMKEDKMYMDFIASN